ncbi:hypothetical protein B0H11DRAFT_2002023 [Mycena galericulata]|nr:hypothetical protein B0H11DRAFT_2002023 [Mycena galericulata]
MSRPTASPVASASGKSKYPPPYLEEPWLPVATGVLLTLRANESSLNEVRVRVHQVQRVPRIPQARRTAPSPARSQNAPEDIIPSRDSAAGARRAAGGGTGKCGLVGVTSDRRKCPVSVPGIKTHAVGRGSAVSTSYSAPRAVHGSAGAACVHGLILGHGVGVGVPDTRPGSGLLGCVGERNGSPSIAAMWTVRWRGVKVV